MLILYHSIYFTYFENSLLNVCLSKSRIALDFKIRAILSERSKNLTLRFSLKIKSFAQQNMFYRSDILYNFLISSF